MQSRKVALGLTLLLLAGCGKTVVISRGPQVTSPPAQVQPVDGLPFYVKHAYCQQSTAWNEPQYTVTVSVSVDDKPAGTVGVGALSRGQLLHDGTLQYLLKNVSRDLDVGTRDDCETYLETKDLGRDLQKTPPENIDDADLRHAIANGDLLLAENTAQMVTYVDYSTVYYYNTNRPLTGTSSVDVKLAADGTLTEGNSSFNDQTLSSVTGVLSSAASGLGSALVPLMASSGPSEKLPHECQLLAGKKVRFDVTTQVRTFRHTHQFKDAAHSEAACNPRLVSAAAACGEGCSLQITELPASGAALPKPDAPAAPKPAGPAPKP